MAKKFLLKAKPFGLSTVWKTVLLSKKFGSGYAGL
jgi:hypothetical protein